jgi:hypothetical protein
MKSKNSVTGTVFGILGILNGIVGVLALVAVSGGKQEAIIISVSGLSGMLICFAVGGILQYLCEISQHLEMCRKHLSKIEMQSGPIELPEMDENYGRKRNPLQQKGGSL